MLYIYEKPFVIEDTKASAYQYISETAHINEFEREDEKQIRSLIFKFLTEHGLITLQSGKISNTHIKDTGSWKWFVNNHNMRSLVDPKHYDSLLLALKADNLYPITILIDLHARLGMFFNTHLLNDIVNRTLQSVQLVPWDTEDSNITVRKSWNDIHKETPFIWLIILIQGIIRNELGKQHL